jgi:hypothetical protein
MRPPALPLSYTAEPWNSVDVHTRSVHGARVRIEAVSNLRGAKIGLL